LFNYELPNQYGTRLTDEHKELEAKRMAMLKARKEFTYNDITTPEGLPEKDSRVYADSSEVRVYEFSGARKD
jgi:hypothetical protein